MVAAGLERSRGCFGLVNGRVDPVFRTRLRLETPRRRYERSLEKALRHFDAVAGLQANVERWVPPKLADVVHLGGISAQQPDLFLISEIVKPPRGINRDQQCHIFGEWHAHGSANSASHADEARGGL